MSAEPKKKMTPEEYLAFERASEERHEYLHGDVLLMEGANHRHSVIKGNIIQVLYPLLIETHFRLYTTAMRIKVSATGFYGYPDFVVIHGEGILEDEYDDTFLDPMLLIEITSRTTEAYDRGSKLHQYINLPSLQAYIIISQMHPVVESYQRTEQSKWEYSLITDLDEVLELPSIQYNLPLADIYLGLYA